LAAAFAALAAAPARADKPLPYPLLANLFLPTQVDTTMIDALSKWDVAIVSSLWTNAELARLRQRNPEIKIYFYAIVYAVERPPASGDPWRLENYEYAAANDMWWYDIFGNPGSDWPGTYMANITALGPPGPQGRWKEYIAARIEQLVATHPDLDGVMLDNYWEEISWQQGFRQLDSDCNPTSNPGGCNGIPDTNEQIDALWNAAHHEIAADLRARFDILQQGRPRPLAIITNNATDYFESLNGVLIEYFPSGHNNIDYDNPHGYNWNEEMLCAPSGYLVAPFLSDPYTLRIVNAHYYGGLWTPARDPTFERNKRFTLVSSVMGDGYYSLDAAAAGHGNLWWEPEYDHAGRGKGYLGQPLGPMVRLLQPTGPEMLTNGDFSAGTDGWVAGPFAGGVGEWSIDPATFRSAPGAARIELTAAPGSGHFKLWQAAGVPVVHHQAYTLSFWARAAAPEVVMFHLYSDECPQGRCWNDHRFFVTTEWQRFEISFRVNGTSAAGFNVFLQDPGTLWLDDVSLRPGDTSLFRRDFEHGVALLNYTNMAQTVSVGETMWRLRIPFSPVFDGAAVTQEIVPPSDGRILMRDSVTVTPPDTGTVSDSPLPAAGHRLLQNEPNPFNPTTRIAFTLGRETPVRLEIVDVAGRRRRVLLDARRPAGPHVVRWDGTDEQGHAMPSGVYLYRLTTPDWSATRKMVLLR
jgi:hypothetical protein